MNRLSGLILNMCFLCRSDGYWGRNDRICAKAQLLGGDLHDLVIAGFIGRANQINQYSTDLNKTRVILKVLDELSSTVLCS